jgi:hypothetical protein
MREDVRFIKMKRIDDVGIAQRLEENQIVVIRPVRSGGDNRMLRRAFANRRR